MINIFKYIACLQPPPSKCVDICDEKISTTNFGIFGGANNKLRRGEYELKEIKHLGQYIRKQAIDVCSRPAYHYWKIWHH